MSSSNTNFDNLLLQTLMGRLQLNPQTHSHPLFSQSLEDLLLSNFSDDDENDDDNTHKTQLAKEESKLEKEIVRVILSGDVESLKPNSGQAVSVGEHHVCVGFHEEDGSAGYRVWEWHGHVMLFDEDNGFSPEYVYGNYFERVRVQRSRTGVGRVAVEEVEEEEEEEKGEEKSGNLGLKELIDGGESNGGRILHRSVGATSTRF